MALYHFSVGHIKRSAGQSAIAAAAYRAGENLYSTYYGELSDYTRKGGVIYSEIMLPPHAPAEYHDRATLWNAVEHAEKHKRAQLAYSFDIALQNELSMDENIALARAFVHEQFVVKGMIADLAVHAPDKKDGGIPNPHFHVLTTMRPLNPDGTWGQKQRREYVFDEQGNRQRDEQGNYIFNAVSSTDWGQPDTLEEWRKQWAEMVNKKFAEKELEVRIDHRSYERQGIEMIPTVHEGPIVRQMETKGIRTEKGELNRWIKATNQLTADLKKRIKSLLALIAEIKKELSQPQAPNLGELISSYYETRNANAWSHKAKGNNLKEFAEIVNYLTANNLLTVDDLQERASALRDRVDVLSDSMKSKSIRLRELEELLRYAEMYMECKHVYEQMKAIRWKGKREAFKADHDIDLRRFYAARRILKEKLGDQPITPAKWKQEHSQLQQEYAAQSKQLIPIRDESVKLSMIKRIVDRAMKQKELSQSKKLENKKYNDKEKQTNESHR